MRGRGFDGVVSQRCSFFFYLSLMFHLQFGYSRSVDRNKCSLIWYVSGRRIVVRYANNFTLGAFSRTPAVRTAIRFILTPMTAIDTRRSE